MVWIFTKGKMKEESGKKSSKSKKKRSEPISPGQTTILDEPRSTLLEKRLPKPLGKKAR